MTDPAKTLLENRIKFFAALGECITEWAYIERHIFELFTTALKADKRLCGSIFWSMPTLSMRLSYTRALIQKCLRPDPMPAGHHPSAVEKEWKDLCGDIEKLLGFRNQIAHQPRASGGEMVTIVMGDPSKTSITGEPDTFIHANPDDPKQTFGTIKTVDLKRHIKNLAALHERLNSFKKTFSSKRVL